MDTNSTNNTNNTNNTNSTADACKIPSRRLTEYVMTGVYVIVSAVIVGGILSAARKENKMHEEGLTTKLDMDRSRVRINNAIASGIETGAIKDVHYRAVQVSDMFDVSGFDTSGNIPG